MTKLGCFQSFKDTRRNQITTLQLLRLLLLLLFSIIQRYKTKSNHNFCVPFFQLLSVVFNHSKIQDEIKSQLHQRTKTWPMCCFQSFKDTRRNQITTSSHPIASCSELFSIIQRYKTKSNHNIELNCPPNFLLFSIISRSDPHGAKIQSR